MSIILIVDRVFTKLKKMYNKKIIEKCGHSIIMIFLLLEI